jgi:hypothetical protein
MLGAPIAASTDAEERLRLGLRRGHRFWNADKKKAPFVSKRALEGPARRGNNDAGLFLVLDQVSFVCSVGTYGMYRIRTRQRHMLAKFRRQKGPSRGGKNGPEGREHSPDKDWARPSTIRIYYKNTITINELRQESVSKTRD